LLLQFKVDPVEIVENYHFKSLIIILMSMNYVTKSIENFEGMNCHQAVLCSFGPEYKLSEEMCFQIGLCYGGGMASQGKTCGAVTGAYTVIGLWAARQDLDRSDQRMIAREKALEFTRLFIESKGSSDCKTLLGYNLSNPQEATIVTNLNLYQTICSKIVGDASSILEKILV
jgi:C_GCAxxG_C_C family probable redox protein